MYVQMYVCMIKKLEISYESLGNLIMLMHKFGLLAIHIEGYYKGSSQCIRIIMCMCVIREQNTRSH